MPPGGINGIDLFVDPFVKRLERRFGLSTSPEKRPMTPRIFTFWLAISAFTMLLIHPLHAQDPNDSGLLAFNPDSRRIRVQNDGDKISFRHLPKDLGRNFRDLLSDHNLAPIALGTGLTGLATILDESEFDEDDDPLITAQEPGQGSSLGRLGERMGNHYIVPGVIAGLAVTGQIVNNRRFEQFSYSLVQGYIVNNLLTTGLKEAVGRTRPNEHDDLSFPSGHTSNAFTWATILSHYYGKMAAIPAFGVATFIAWSRLNVDAHYTSDVIFGAFLGYVVGRTVVQTTDERALESRPRWNLTAGLQGARVTASYDW